MIRSALQAILSKLLYKYVENLHVNDLLYPSMCGFVTGAGSGYANNKSSPSIHVKHVKLRNGTVIYNTAADNSQKEDQTSAFDRGSVVLKLGEGGYIGSLKVGMEGSDYCITVEDAVVVLELFIDDIPPEGKSDGHMNVDEHSSTEISAKPTEKTKNIENDTTLRSSELANESVSTNTPSASVSGGPTTSTPRSVVDIIDSISRTLAALPRIRIINCQIHLNIFLMTQVASEKPRQQYAFIQAGIGSFTISLPEFIENETEVTEQGEVKTQPMVVRHFKFADGGFWIKIHKTKDNVNASSSRIRSHKRSPSTSRTFFHTVESLSTFANSTSNSLWACDRWETATSSYSNTTSTSFPMTIFFKCPSLQMSTKWEYTRFRTINGSIEEYIYEHTIDYPMLFDYQSIQQSSSTVEDDHQEKHGSGMVIRLSITKHVELNVDKDILDVIGVIVTAASDANKTRNEERHDPIPSRQTSSQRLFLGVNNDMIDQNTRLELKASGTTAATQSPNCTIDLHVSKIVLRIQQCPLADSSSRYSSLYSFSFWNFNVNSFSYKLNLRLQKFTEKEVVVTMECTVRKIALNKFMGAQPKQILVTLESVSGVDNTLTIAPRYDPIDSKSACSIQHNNTSEAALHGLLWFAIPPSTNKYSSTTNNRTAMHLSLLVGSVTASLSSVLVQELSETLADVERRLFQVKEVGQYGVVRRQHNECNVKTSRKVEQDQLETIIINYDVKIGCASILWDDKIRVKLESSFLKGCKTYPDNDNVQMFLKSLLDCITIEIGGSIRGSESRKSLGSLPDGVRMLVLLYVGDETAGLEQALNVPPDTNRLMHMINLNQRLSLI